MSIKDLGLQNMVGGWIWKELINGQCSHLGKGCADA